MEPKQTGNDDTSRPVSDGDKRGSDSKPHIFRIDGPFAPLPTGKTLPPLSSRTFFVDAPNEDVQPRHLSTSSNDSGYATGPHLFPRGSQEIPNGFMRPPSSSRNSSASQSSTQSSTPQPVQQQPLPPFSNNQNRPACIPCRKKKVGCDLRLAGSDYDPPCLRCRNEDIRCYFAGSENIPSNPSPQELPSIRDLACQHCSLVFLRDQDLRAHLRTQCTEKHYVCNQCQARFRRLNDLDRHARIHTGERPHTCDICTRRFSRATTLTRHKQGPSGCAGRRADLGRRRIGSYHSASDSNPSTPSEVPSSAGSAPYWSPMSPDRGSGSSHYGPHYTPPPPLSHRYSEGTVQEPPGTRQFPPPVRRYSSTDAGPKRPPGVLQRPSLQRFGSDASVTMGGMTPVPQGPSSPREDEGLRTIDMGL